MVGSHENSFGHCKGVSNSLTKYDALIFFPCRNVLYTSFAHFQYSVKCEPIGHVALFHLTSKPNKMANLTGARVSILAAF
uniref:Uncharacterized protein n=1 Tax=Arundo donax TaxID=35708 RepID=A0A0A9GNX1_ARUDO